MGQHFPAFVRVEPSYVDPAVIVQFTQPSGAFETLYGGGPEVRLGEGDQYVYMNTLQVRTKVAAGQSNTYNNLPSCSIVGGQISTPTYLQRNRAEWDHHDAAAAARYGVALPQANSLALRQGHFIQLRNALLYGFNPQNGEGLLNTPNATLVPLPDDPFGHDTVVTYDNGAMATFFLTQMAAAKARMYQAGIGNRFVVLGPQRVLLGMEYQGIVQLTQYQRDGAGVANIRTMVQEVITKNGDVVEWVYDDTLEGKGINGADAVLLVVPEIKKPRTVNRIDTNAFAGVKPSYTGTVRQLIDMAAPREILSPLPGGAIDMLAELRTTSGWAVRSDGVTILSMPYQ